MCCAIRGWSGARAPSSSPSNRREPCFPGYLAAYEFQSYDLDGSIAEVIRRLRTGITRPFPKGSFGKGVLNFYLSPIGPVRHAN